MRLAVGDRLGPYEIVGTLGTGGMGEVYRARDPRLGRDVAIKVLPAERTADEGRRRRFVQEARAASALSHPNIVTIHEIESADGCDFIAMEYVPGQSLDGMIPRRGMPVREALRLAIPIADALAAAHCHGIVHRDLKPANVMVSRVVKLLDFGVAKLLAEDRDGTMQSSTASGVAGLSGPEAVIGTAAYMSPEQATGGKVDARSDIFSFGALLYEMVTGRRAFAGKTVSETLAAIVRDQPRPPRELVPDIPEALERLILLCLRKEPERRLQHMADVVVELRDIAERAGSAPQSPTPSVRRRRVLLSALAVCFLVATAAMLLHRPAWLQPSPAPHLVALTSTPGSENSPTFSPDGNQIAFTWDGDRQDNVDIYVKMIGSPEAYRLTTDPAIDSSPSWSPDGSRIAFVRLPKGSPTGTIHVVSPLGGADRKLSGVTVGPSGLSWSRDGRRLAAGPVTFTGPWIESRGSVLPADPELNGIRLIDTSTGEARPLTSTDKTIQYYSPAFSPDGRYLAFFSCPRGSCQLDVVEVGPDGQPRGPARRLTRKAVGPRGVAWSRDSRSLVYGDVYGYRLWRVGIEGDTAPERIEIAGYYAFWPSIAVSRDRLAFMRLTSPAHLYRLRARGQPEIVAGSSFLDYNPRFSPDGRRLAWMSERSGERDEIWIAAADGTNPVQLTQGPGVFQGPGRWSPDGRRIAFQSLAEDGNGDVWTIDADGGPPLRVTANPANDRFPSWSRDGRFLYFSSNRTGTETMWRVPSTGGSEEQVTRTGGGISQESTDGETLLYQSFAAGNAPLMAVSLKGGQQRMVVDCAGRNAWELGAAGLYYEPCGADMDKELRWLDLKSGRDRPVAVLPKAWRGLTVSPDGETIVFTSSLAQGNDLMLIENFH